MKKRNFAIFLILILLAITTRFVLLGLRPIHHDEGMLSYFAWQLAEGGDYTYTPQIHGPILFYLQAIVFKIFGTGDSAVRASMALFGVVLATLPLAFYKKLGIGRAIAVSILIIASPLLTYFSRFSVHTGLVVVANLMIILSLWLLVKTLRPYYLYIFAIFMAMAFGISETSYIFLSSLVLLLPFYFLINRKNFWLHCERIKIFFVKNYLDFISAFLVFLLCWIFIYSVGLTSSRSLLLSLPNPFSSEGSLGFWLAQHDNKLGGQPWFYYLMLFTVYEPLVLLGGFLAAIESVRRRGGILQILVVFLGFASLVGYSIAGEKFPWLILPTLMLFAFASGLYFGRNFVKSKPIIQVILIILGLFTLFNNFRLNFINPADTREVAVYVQTPNSFREIADRVRSDCKGYGDDCVVIDSEISWPLSWDFKNISRLDHLTNPDGVSANTKYVFVSEGKVQNFDVTDFAQKKILLRDWWVPPVCRKIGCINEYLKYFLNREIWGLRGGYEIIMLERK
jgi:uncharacterized protein (TIGR03663 family)